MQRVNFDTGSNSPTPDWEEDFEKYSIDDEIDVHKMLGQAKLPGG